MNKFNTVKKLMNGQSAGNKLEILLSFMATYYYFGSSETKRHALELSRNHYLEDTNFLFLVDKNVESSVLLKSSHDLYWAIGLFEAEGTLWVRDDRICISLCQLTKNIQVLYKVKSIMGIGKIRIRRDDRYSD